ncbi:DNA ligase D [Tabrizicola sp. BL-A-41-H6]|uniref:DNA ligase D n=1 Tax=Tabrizicola sp. BL-A-41-H6 TaxID=3421107 RepID=UPI003D671BC7
MALETYREKRNFGVTPEPKGRRAKGKGNSFVVQKHDATRLHYDLRLEMDGVLKSWAVTRGPSLVAGEKRLAVHVEDHPLEYGDFEGTIPKGEYGAGTVILWDRGQWMPVGDAAKGYAKGHLEFELQGEKLRGGWHLVRMQAKPGEKRENWLLIKADDEYSRPENAPDLLEESPLSVKTGRDLPEVATEAPGWSSKTGHIAKPGKPRAKLPEPDNDAEPRVADVASLPGAKRARLPEFVEPMLAKLAPSPPTGERWLHEIKFDGYRLQARIKAGQVRLLTRSGLDWTAKFGPELVKALVGLPAQAALLDGELVVETELGASSFSALQSDLSEGRTDRFVYYAFDLLHFDGHDLRKVPFIQRKAVLERLIATADRRVAYSDHFVETGDMVLRHACRLSLEGIVSKLRDAPYRTGRGTGWIKSKCSDRQEFVIGGYVPSTTSRQAVGSLVLGVHEASGLTYVGRVGTGFSASVAASLFLRLEAIAVPESPFASPLTVAQRSQVRFVKPDLVAEVEFRAWTADGHLRHAAFRGLREDKPATEIRREVAVATTAPAPQRRTVKLTHPDRIYWPDAGVTKEGLADYYAEVWPHIAPHIVGRPLALLRCPEGIEGQQFFQKHAWKGLSDKIALVEDPKDRGEKLIAVNDLDGLIGLVQAATLEIHPWGSTLADWERPDRIVIDLDPGEGVVWGAVLNAAREVRQRCRDAGLKAYVKTSGGKGLHVVCPLKPQADWAAVKTFTRRMAEAMAADSSDLYVSTIAKAKRQGKILIDYLRNQRGATAVAAFSTRARRGAPVSTPVTWDELTEKIGPAHFKLDTVPARLAALASDPWDGFWKAGVLLKTPAKGRKG